MKDKQLPLGPDFPGVTYDPGQDKPRLVKQIEGVRTLMLRNGAYRTLAEIEELTGYPPASISARLRDLDNPKFGGYLKNKRRRGGYAHGEWEYQILKPLDIEEKDDSPYACVCSTCGNRHRRKAEKQMRLSLPDPKK